ncbi:unnamed protein product (macronuclear) [Paramecium tetraurelia]|uniref:LITAF domain-containing protein n=1 Tax=Paramecium tetraurelia TaxID=5888 RepID=A0EF54_PARTE|nr:uncharacterized protein GSPATT00026268001 [Paramecium tetraurelia]CAK93945.1 unnamed protein product [Paramecium tetraurelia]|eukprot:XP_001461318.1 hypothetical protein (macronuclear) [Paramecium tetraurelia strain d4-2]
MQNNGHVRLASEITPTPYEGPASGVVYPQLPNPNMQIGQPIQPIVPTQQYVRQIPYQQQQYPQIQQLQQVTYNPTAIQQVQPVYSKYPHMITCAYCQRQVQTQVYYEVGTGAYAAGGLLAAVGLWLGCCLIPFFVKDCKDAVHFCPSCQAKIGKKRFLFD